MANATYVSDLERAEHLGYADGAGVKRVSVYNNGTQVNVATEDTLQDSLSHYQLANLDVASDPLYLGFLDKNGKWYINKISISGGTSEYVKGDSGYNWGNRASESYGAFDSIF